jgi:hypothetical protein
VTEIHYDSRCPAECPSSPGSDPVRCSMMAIRTGSEIIQVIEQCTRCGWTDPASLDRWAELWYKRRLDKMEQRIALATSGEPFTFVRGSDQDITLNEALGQALGAASMCWQYPERAGEFQSERAARIYGAIRAFIDEVYPERQPEPGLSEQMQNCS